MLLLKKVKTQENKILDSTWRLLLLGCIFFMWSITGCKEPPSPPKRTEVVRQKIVVQKGMKATTDESKKAPKEAPDPISKTVQEKTIPPVSKEPQRPTAQPVLEGGKKITEPVTKEKQEPERPVYSYNPAGKIDPFRPIFSDRASGRVPGSRKGADKTVPLTPLQKIDIDQVKLVGIIVSPSGNKAMVQDASGKGYIITKGTYIGMNFGKVVKILKKKVVIHEEIEDYISGKIEIREVTLELPQKYKSGSMQ